MKKNKNFWQGFFLAVIFVFSPGAHAEFIITIGGDLNLNPSNTEPDSRGSCKHGQCYYWEELFKGLQPLLIGNLNFYNLETVVTAGNESLSAHGGKYLFRTHEEGIRYAKKIGLNWAGVANNHVGDYGIEGLFETMTSLQKISQEPGLFLYHGVARNRSEILKPAVLEYPMGAGQNPIRIAFAAITFVRNTPMQVGYDNPGVIYPENKKDLEELLKNMRNIDADFKVMSIHGGREAKVQLDSWQHGSYVSMLEMGDLDLIIGHHPHRVRPVEKIGDKIIFYSLGNYLMLGASALNDLPTPHSYGLMGRLYLDRMPTGRLKIRTMEAIPLYNMQSQVFALTGEYAQLRIEALNALSLQEVGNSAVEWSIGPQGWGVTCVSGECNHATSQGLR